MGFRADDHRTQVARQPASCSLMPDRKLWATDIREWNIQLISISPMMLILECTQVLEEQFWATTA
jgi:hypothetical protein